MAGLNQKIFPETLRSISSSTFTGSYQLIGSSLNHECRLIRLYNDSSVDVTISWDGVNDHEFLPTKAFILIDISANNEIDKIFVIGKGTSIYVKGSVGTGSVYLSAYFAR